VQESFKPSFIVISRFYHQCSYLYYINFFDLIELTIQYVQITKLFTPYNFCNPFTYARVGIATGCILDGRGSIPGRSKIFLFSVASRPALRPTQPPIQWVPGALSPRVKRSGRGADHSPPPSAEVSNGILIPSLPLITSWNSA
jgi:hypothetical protein